MTDPSQLVARAQTGEADAIGHLYDQHQAEIFRYLWARVGERALAEDLTGEVFMRMLTGLPGYRPSAAPFRAWLYQIARNLLIDHYRKTGKRTMVSLQQSETVKDHSPDLVTLVDQRLTMERVHRALTGLDAAQRDVVTLRFLSGLSLQEVAQTLGKTENAVKALQHRGLAALRQALHPAKATP
jgi:RNA polymerase sigma-70 factor, ECF subfamily